MIINFGVLGENLVDRPRVYLLLALTLASEGWIIKTFPLWSRALFTWLPYCKLLSIKHYFFPCCLFQKHKNNNISKCWPVKHLKVFETAPAVLFCFSLMLKEIESMHIYCCSRQSRLSLCCFCPSPQKLGIACSILGGLEPWHWQVVWWSPQPLCEPTKGPKASGKLINPVPNKWGNVKPWGRTPTGDLHWVEDDWDGKGTFSSSVGMWPGKGPVKGVSCCLFSE